MTNKFKILYKKGGGVYDYEEDRTKLEDNKQNQLVKKNYNLEIQISKKQQMLKTDEQKKNNQEIILNNVSKVNETQGPPQQIQQHLQQQLQQQQQNQPLEKKYNLEIQISKKQQMLKIDEELKNKQEIILNNVSEVNETQGSPQQMQQQQQNQPLEKNYNLEIQISKKQLETTEINPETLENKISRQDNNIEVLKDRANELFNNLSITKDITFDQKEIEQVNTFINNLDIINENKDKIKIEIEDKIPDTFNINIDNNLEIIINQKYDNLNLNDTNVGDLTKKFLDFYEKLGINKDLINIEIKDGSIIIEVTIKSDKTENLSRNNNTRQKLKNVEKKKSPTGQSSAIQLNDNQKNLSLQNVDKVSSKEIDSIAEKPKLSRQDNSKKIKIESKTNSTMQKEKNLLNELNKINNITVKKINENRIDITYTDSDIIEKVKYITKDFEEYYNFKFIYKN